MAVVINGTDVLIFIDGVRVGNTTSFTLNVNMTKRPTSNKDTGKYNTSAVGRMDVNATCDALVVYDDMMVMLNACDARVPVHLHFAEDLAGSPDTSKFYAEGDFIIVDMVMTAQDQDNYNYTCSFDHYANFTFDGNLALRVGVLGTNCSANAVEDGFVAAFPRGGTAPYTFVWNADPSLTTQALTDLAPGTYTVVVTDAASDTATAEVTITEPPA